jgi:uncharacterized membrane protein YgcG
MKLASSNPLSRTARFLKPHLIFVFLFFALAANAEKIKDIHPTGYVTDLAGVINADTKTRLENLCLELEQKTGAQMAIVTVRSLDAGRLMRSYFLQGNYSAGIEAAAWQLAKYVADDRGVTLTATPPARPVRRRDDSPSIPIWPILIFIFVVINIIRAVSRGGSGRGGRGSGWWIGPMIGGMLGGGGGGGFGGSSGGGGGGGGFGGFGGGSSGGGGASGSW